MRKPPFPCDPITAVLRANKLVKSGGGQYMLGTGDYVTPIPTGSDLPWTTRDGVLGCDCAGLVCWSFMLPRHRPGYNRGSWATVSDDLNCNSMIEDSEHDQEIWEPCLHPEMGCVLAYPTFRIKKDDGEVLTFIGHTCVVVGVSRVLEWDSAAPQYHLLDVAQVKGPNGRKPAAIATDGSIWDHHDSLWPKPEHRTRMIRVKSTDSPASSR